MKSERQPFRGISEADAVDVGKGRERMRCRPRRADDFGRLDAAYDERIGDERTMTSPWDCLGAHDRGRSGRGEVDQLVERRGKWFGLHVVRIPAKGIVAPAEVDRVRAGSTQAAERRHVSI